MRNPYKPPKSRSQRKSIKSRSSIRVYRGSYADTPFLSFEGRLGRLRMIYYYIVGEVILVLIVLGIIYAFPNLIAMSSLLVVLVIFSALLGLSLGIRRLHDMDYSGWFILLAFVPVIGNILPFVFVLMPGTRDNNHYGEPAKPINFFMFIVIVFVGVIVFGEFLSNFNQPY